MNKKDRIIQAAVDVFYEKGIEKTKISDITQAAGIAQGTFYLYFPSKLALMPSIAEKIVANLMTTIKENIDENASFEQQIKQIIDTVFYFVKEHRTIYAFIYTGLSQTEHLKEWDTIYLPFYQWMSDFLKKHQTSGKVNSDIPLQRLSSLVINLVESTAEQMYLYNYTNEENIELQKEALISFLNNALNVKN